MVGIDLVDVTRLRKVLGRSPKLAEKLFTIEELAYANERSDPVLHLAGTLAAKEATVKALGLSSLVKWTKAVEISRGPDGKPSVAVYGAAGDRWVTISISHDAGIATAVAMETDGGDIEPAERRDRIPALVFTSQMELCLIETGA